MLPTEIETPKGALRFMMSRFFSQQQHQHRLQSDSPNLDDNVGIGSECSLLFLHGCDYLDLITYFIVMSAMVAFSPKDHSKS